MAEGQRPKAEAPYGPYDRFAALYSWHMAEDFCRRVFPAIDSLLLQTLAPGAHILDLCCGAGQFSRALLARGFHVTGFDRSQAMLRLAQANAPGAALLCGDARNFAFVPASF